MGKRVRSITILLILLILSKNLKMNKRTPLYETHLAHGAKMVEFAGWEMPVQYRSIIEEHRAVRQAAGLFDISHMGEFFVKGAQAAAWLNTLLTNDTSKLQHGGSQYTLLLNEKGGVIDDLFLYKLSDEIFFLVVNASKIDEDFSWLQSKLAVGATLENVSEKMAALALQGPSAEKIIKNVFQKDFSTHSRNQIAEIIWQSEKILVSRTGYTGEDGFELFFNAKKAAALWEEILKIGKSYGCEPVGLGARDTLRLEACLPLNGHDLSEDITPLEAGLKKFVSFEKKENFIGRIALENSKPKRISVAFMMQELGPPPRQHYAVYNDEEKIGEVTSGGVSPTLQKNIGMALVDCKAAASGSNIFIEVRGRKFSAAICPKPLYKRKSS